MKPIIIATLLLWGSNALAGTLKGNVDRLEFGPYIGSKVYVKLSNVSTSATQPECMAGTYHFGFDAATESGKITFSALLAAQRAKSEVEINGYGHCNTFSSAEDLRWVRTY